MNAEEQITSIPGNTPCCAEPSLRSLVSEESGDMFTDSNCGEPLASQRIVLDFTPNEDQDTDYVQRKCVAFWDFVSQNPNLQTLETAPDYNVFDKSSSTPSSSYVPDKLDSTVDVVTKEKTAVSMLELVEGKGLIDRAFEGKLVQSYCSMGMPEYSEEESIAVDQDKVYNGDEKQKIQKRPERQTSRGMLKKMCLKLEEWDVEHPQSTEAHNSLIITTQDTGSSGFLLVCGCQALPKIKQDPKKTNHLCKCRPICKSRRREWKGEVQNTSAELLLERKPLQECFRRWPTKVFPNSPCPLFATTRRVTVKERNYIPPPSVVRVCQAPIDETVDSTYLKLAQLAKKLGAWDAVRACCAFCDCIGCCACSPHGYELQDEPTTTRQIDMKMFDTRVKRDCQDMKIMYS